LIYTDSAQKRVGFVDITNPAQPQPLGTVEVGGEPTSVAVAGPYALVAVDTSLSFISPSGVLKVYHIGQCLAQIAACVPQAEIDMQGQPDSVAVSPDRRFAAVAVENERDEDVSVDGVEGGLPQLPGGFLQVVDLQGTPPQWSTRLVDLSGLSDYAPEDPEPEYVSINQANIAAVTLQENNHIVLVHLRSGKVVRDFPAGAVTLAGIDTEENQLIEFDSGFQDRPREPDAIVWLGGGKLLTANEGDLFGGTRGWTLYGANGQVLKDAGKSFEYLGVRHGHFPEARADAKGTEPEGVASARYGNTDYAFVGSERGNFVAVYRLRGTHLDFVQLLPTGIGPEGLLAIPQRNLFVVATEEDGDEPGAIRSQINIYRLQPGPASYPDIVSADTDGHPIGWGALSALAADRTDADVLYTVHDNFYVRSRIYTLDVSQEPAVIAAELPLRDAAGEPVNYDLEGLVQREGGGFWAVSEGAGNGNVCDPANADTRRTRCNILVKVASDGLVEEEIFLPAALNAKQRSNGFEGVAVTGTGADETVYVAFQREWTGDPSGQVRIGVYKAGSWSFLYYPLDPVESPAGGFVGLSEITALGGERFAVLERDNQGGQDARIKRIYVISVAGLTPAPEGSPFPVIAKTSGAPAIDLLPYLQSTNGYVLDKPEGFAIGADGNAYFNTDNDGVDDALGESRLFRLGRMP
jgi:hypothetical protein